MVRTCIHTQFEHCAKDEALDLVFLGKLSTRNARKLSAQVPLKTMAKR